MEKSIRRDSSGKVFAEELAKELSPSEILIEFYHPEKIRLFGDEKLNTYGWTKELTGKHYPILSLYGPGEKSWDFYVKCRNRWWYSYLTRVECYYSYDVDRHASWAKFQVHDDLESICLTFDLVTGNRSFYVSRL